MMVGQRITSDEEDRAEVEVLSGRLEKTAQLTKKVKSSQIRLDASGRSVQEAIGPIYANTQRLQILGTNIDRIDAAIDKLRKPQDIKKQEDAIIRAGPQLVQLKVYTDSMTRVFKALLGLDAANLRSNQTAKLEMKDLLGEGNRMLLDLFQRILVEYSRTVEPLHYITKNLPFPRISDEHASAMRHIVSFGLTLARQGYPEEETTQATAHTYENIRALYLASSLQNLAAATVNTARRKSSEDAYRRGNSALGVYTNAMDGLLTAEYETICTVFAVPEPNAIYQATCRGALSDFAKTLRELDAQIKTNVPSECFLAYEVIDAVSELSSRLNSKTGALTGAFTEALKPIRETATSSMSDLLEDLRRRVIQTLSFPNDGAALPLTTEVMMRMQSLVDFSKPVSAILINLGEGNWVSRPASASSASVVPTLKPIDVEENAQIEANGRRLLARYCLDTVETFLQNIDAKARVLYRNKAVLGVFIANNVAVIDRTVRTTDLATLFSDSYGRIESWRKKGVSLYLECWKEPSAYLLDVQHTSRGGQRPPSGTSTSVNSAEYVKNLSSKDKDAIKDKFRNFNNSFEDMLHKHKTLTMEREVRSAVGKEVQALIEPLYGRFWDRYHEIDKGKGKYVKYDKGQLSAVLAGLT